MRAALGVTISVDMYHARREGLPRLEQRVSGDERRRDSRLIRV